VSLPAGHACEPASRGHADDYDDDEDDEELRATNATAAPRTPNTKGLQGPTREPHAGAGKAGKAGKQRAGKAGKQRAGKAGKQRASKAGKQKAVERNQYLKLQGKLRMAAIRLHLPNPRIASVRAHRVRAPNLTKFCQFRLCQPPARAPPVNPLCPPPT
jgi:hypothetical protein